MTTTMNGRSVIATADARLATISAGGRSTRVLAGDTATVLGYVAARFHAEVEPLATLYGWRSLATNMASGGISNSNHLSGTALDLNGAQHPRYRHDTYTAAELAALRRILADVNAAAGATVVRWGGDWGSDVDEMHVEVVGSTLALARAAAWIRVHPVSHTTTTTGAAPTAPTLTAPAPVRESAPTLARRRTMWTIRHVRTGKTYSLSPGLLKHHANPRQRELAEVFTGAAIDLNTDEDVKNVLWDFAVPMGGKDPIEALANLPVGGQIGPA